MSYDKKFRQKALSYLNEGHTVRETAKIFGVHYITIQGWKTQLEKTGYLELKKRKETWRKIDPEKLKQYVAENPDAYQHEIAQAFGVRLFAIQKALKRLNLTRKKNNDLQRK